MATLAQQADDGQAKTPREEMIEEFQENCPLQRDETAEHVLGLLFDLNIGELLGKRRIQWGGREKKFALACMAGLGRQVFKVRNGSGMVSGSDVMTAVDREISCWERTCPLPTVSSTTLDRSCRTVQEMLSARAEILSGKPFERGRRARGRGD